MLSALSSLGDASLSYQLPGEKAAVTDTPYLKLAVESNNPDALMEASAPGSSFGGLQGALSSNNSEPINTKVKWISLLRRHAKDSPDVIE